MENEHEIIEQRMFELNDRLRNAERAIEIVYKFANELTRLNEALTKNKAEMKS